MKNKTILAIPDLHFPFHHPDTFRFLKELKREYKPDTVVQLGDIQDQHANSRWGADPDGRSAGDEYLEAVALSKQFFKIFPKGKMVSSNHDSRVAKCAMQAGLSRHVMKDMSEILQLPKTWEFHRTLELQDILYIHGEGLSNLHNTPFKIGKSVVFGHSHSLAGVQYHRNHSGQIFSMCAGCLIDEDAYAFEYAKLNVRKQIFGAGVIKNGVPMFIPLR